MQRITKLFSPFSKRRFFHLNQIFRKNTNRHHIICLFKKINKPINGSNLGRDLFNFLRIKLLQIIQNIFRGKRHSLHQTNNFRTNCSINTLLISNNFNKLSNSILSPLWQRRQKNTRQLSIFLMPFSSSLHHIRMSHRITHIPRTQTMHTSTNKFIRPLMSISNSPHNLNSFIQKMILLSKRHQNSLINRPNRCITSTPFTSSRTKKRIIIIFDTHQNQISLNTLRNISKRIRSLLIIRLLIIFFYSTAQLVHIRLPTWNITKDSLISNQKKQLLIRKRRRHRPLLKEILNF